MDNKSRRSPLIVLENVRKITAQNGSDDDILNYIASEGFSPDEIEKVPIPKNLSSIAPMIKAGEMIGGTLSNAPGFLGELARNPKLAEASAPILGQIVGNAIGGIAGSPAGPVGAIVGSKLGGATGATAGEAFSQAIKIVRGEQVSPENALKEVLHTGSIATASEILFGQASPGGKLLNMFGKELSKLGKPLTEQGSKLFAQIAQITSGRVSPEDTMELIRRGADNVLIPENMGTSINEKVINKATQGLEYIRKAAQQDFERVVKPLEQNPNLVTLAQPIADDFASILKSRGFIDDKGNILTGLIGDGKEASKLKEILRKVSTELVEPGKFDLGAKTVIKPRQSVNFRELLSTRRELDSMIDYAKQRLAVSPKSTNYQAALKGLRGRISEELDILGGEAFSTVNREFSEASGLFDDLFKIFKTKEGAERTLENVIKSSRQMRLFNLKDLNKRIPKNLQFMDDLENYALAMKFRDEGYNLLRAGIIGGLLGFQGMSSAGPLGAALGLGSAFFATTPKGIGMTIKASQQLNRYIAANVNNLVSQAQNVLPVTATTIGRKNT